MNNILQVARNEQDKNKVDYLLNLLEPGQNYQVHDPFYGEIDDYERTFRIIEPACIALVNKIKNTK
jgi:protein-tyrosine phosphatase